MNVILCGFKSCGKSSVGKAFALKAGMSFIDTDEKMLSLASQNTIRDLYLEIGESEFRKIETECIQQLMGVSDTVIALGGGTLVNLDNLRLIKMLGKLVYLQVALPVLQARILKQAYLPGYMQSPEDIQRHYQSRIVIYRENADFIIEAGSDPIEKIVLTVQEVCHGQ